ncbi:hypothetical protein HZH68_012465 [Vespula germanica]|uniref:Uncharacterized protein n=1 Tax=Vespula germanica TaxID=30212 RepID=A0A834JHM1_VESGE|nr:hypothetical protein HZH68_012465 [Vespula germanica]
MSDSPLLVELFDLLAPSQDDDDDYDYDDDSDDGDDDNDDDDDDDNDNMMATKVSMSKYFTRWKPQKF